MSSPYPFLARQDPCLIRGARIVDGSGAPWFRGDVEVREGRIARMGPDIAPEGLRVVEADGRYLAPGFIDAHCHDDLVALREPGRPEKALQGVSSVVVGNCSFSLYPAVPDSREALRAHFAALLGETRPDEIFGDLAAYRARLHDKGAGINVVSLVGHAALRLAAMGYDRRCASEAEIATMAVLLDRQFQQGAAGLSLGLVYPPSAFAEIEEMVALARIARRHGRLMTAHVRSYEDGLLPAIEEFLEILRRSGAAGLLSHLQSAGRPNWGQIPAAIALLEAARAEGIDVAFDMYPYPAGSTYLLQLLPPAALEGGLEALRSRLREGSTGPAIREWVERGGPAFPGQSKVSLIGWENVRVSGIDAPALKHLEGLSMPDAAHQLGLHPFDLLLRLVDEDDGKTGIILFQLDEADLHAACCHRLYMVGSDGLPRPGTKPHPRAYGTFPRVAGRLRREGWFTLEDAVRRMTSMSAQRFGLSDRGLVRPGLVADLVLFEDAIEDRATFEHSTLMPSGVAGLWVNGGQVVSDGTATGARPGRLLNVSEI